MVTRMNGCLDVAGAQNELASVHDPFIIPSSEIELPCCYKPPSKVSGDPGNTVTHQAGNVIFINNYSTASATMVMVSSMFVSGVAPSPAKAVTS